MKIYYLIILLIGISIIPPVFSQDLPETNAIKTVTGLYEVLDTLEQSDYNISYSLNWMGTEIGISESIKDGIDMDYQRKFARDSSFVFSYEDSIKMHAFSISFAQNCHSYALEKVFGYYGIDSSPVFSRRTSVLENYHMANLIPTCFGLVQSLETKPKKNLKTPFTIGSILVFLNKSGQTIHTVYYDGTFHSKNGGWPAITTDKLKDIYKTYWDTALIREYRLDLSKIYRYNQIE